MEKETTLDQLRQQLRDRETETSATLAHLREQLAQVMAINNNKVNNVNNMTVMENTEGKRDVCGPDGELEVDPKPLGFQSVLSTTTETGKLFLKV